MEHISEILKIDIRNNRTVLKLTAAEFKAEFEKVAADVVSTGFSSTTKYKITASNKDVINNLYWYLSMSPKFKGDMMKGILIFGGYGTGKTTLMRIIAEILSKHCQKHLAFISCVNLQVEIKEMGIDYFKKRPMILDEIGRESKVVKDYGTERHPFQEILSMRYNERAWTFGTSNYNLEDLKEMYGGYIEDRIREMFNIFELKGKSFRKSK